MLNEKEYYVFLYDNFLKPNQEEFEKAKIWYESHELFAYDDEYREIIKILDVIQTKYEFNMQRMCKNNFELLSLFQFTFMRKIDKKQREAGLKFMIACCFADKILDSKRFSKVEQQEISDALSIKVIKNKNKFCKELLLLLSDVYTYLEKYEDIFMKKMLSEMIWDAFESEQYMWKNKLVERELVDKSVLHFLIDKSVKFEKAALLLVLKEQISEQAINVAQIIGEIFWLTDDLCDFISDLKEQRKNSLLYWNIPNKYLDLNERVVLATENMKNNVSQLEDCINNLKKSANQKLYLYVIYMVKMWFGNIENIVTRSSRKLHEPNEYLLV